MNTVSVTVGGISCAGKSTRVRVLKEFLDAEGFTYEPATLAKNPNKPFGWYYPDLNLLIVGKYVERNGNQAFQGLDSFTGFLGGDEGQKGLYDYIYQWAQTYNIVLDASLMLRTPYNRPKMWHAHAPNANVINLMFCANSVAEYAERLAVRSTRTVTEDSPMWKTNHSFRRQVEQFNEELKLTGLPDTQYKSKQLSIDAALDIVGVSLLLAIRREELSQKFTRYCHEHLKEYVWNS